MNDAPHSILVMGGAGYIGSHTVRHLLDRGYHHMVVADNLIYGHREAVDARAAFEHADLLNARRPGDPARQRSRSQHSRLAAALHRHPFHHRHGMAVGNNTAAFES